MSALDLFWTLLALAALEPFARRCMRGIARRWRIAALQRKRGSRVVLLVHREETLALLGFPIARQRHMDPAEDVLRAIQLADREQPIDLILHTPPGRQLAALQIARALRAHAARVTVFVPHYAMSGGTLIALAADEISMSPHAVLGPIDPQFGAIPAASLIKVAGQKAVDAVDDYTLVLADMGRKAAGCVREAARELLHGHLPAHQAEALAKILSTGKWTPEHPISHALAKELGLPVSADIPREVVELMRLYPQPTAACSLEYTPPRPPERAAGVSAT
jgi:ClpP class serine protease